MNSIVNRWLINSVVKLGFIVRNNFFLSGCLMNLLRCPFNCSLKYIKFHQREVSLVNSPSLHPVLVKVVASDSVQPG